jgi:hypothetical protein
MKKLKFLALPSLHALAVVIYVGAVATLMAQIERFNPEPHLNPAMMISLFLLLFVISAATVVSLIFVRPLLMYLDGKKKEGLLFLGATILALIIVFAVAITIIILR